MKFNNWRIDELIKYILDCARHCENGHVPRVSGEIYVFNGENVDEQSKQTIKEAEA